MSGKKGFADSRRRLSIFLRWRRTRNAIKRRAKRRAAKPPMAPPAMAPAGGLAEGEEIAVGTGVEDVGVVGVGPALVVEVVVCTTVELAEEVGVGLDVVVEATVRIVLVVLLSMNMSAVVLIVVTSSLATLLVAWICLPSISAMVGVISGAGVIAEKATKLAFSTCTVSDVMPAPSSVLIAVGTLRFGPVSSRMAAWRDLRPKIPVLRAKSAVVESNVEVKVSVKLRGSNRPFAAPLRSGTIILLDACAVQVVDVENDDGWPSYPHQGQRRS